MQKVKQVGAKLLQAFIRACTLILIILPATLFLLQVVSLVTALPFASWPKYFDPRSRLGIGGSGDLHLP